MILMISLLLFFRCICLAVELSDNAQTHEDIVGVLPLVSKAAEFKHYSHHLYLLETLCKQVIYDLVAALFQSVSLSSS